ncbi:unnamed protein product [Paramecium sonneborni]|uniref:Uncharacterized protein n=1 Tax=Paramecium sonneborni TaxID=65129 RepID=A0A8S1L0V0_9CILI|nr:unnamed protein product [Paramecium sonneborni]CAD8059809.1 unnamed protein product [Paramecium sonneborni]
MRFKLLKINYTIQMLLALIIVFIVSKSTRSYLKPHNQYQQYSSEQSQIQRAYTWECNLSFAE